MGRRFLFYKILRLNEMAFFKIKKMQKVIIVEDHQLVRQGIKDMLESSSAYLQVVAEATSARELFAVLQHMQADIVLLDLNLPDKDGMEIIGPLKDRYPDMKVIILSMMDQRPYVIRAMEAGADGYLSKACSREELLHALQFVAAGNKYLTPIISLKLLEKAAEPVDRPQILSARELEVLRLLAEGYTAEQIAGRIFVSRRTVETHRQNILEKTKTRNTAHLIVYAARQCLLD
jgi:DNA-binding NarL/FixJ family response regulator